MRKAKPRASRLRAWIQRLLVAGLTAGLLGGAALAGVLWYYGRNLPTVASLRSYQPSQVTRVLDRQGGTLGEVFEERRTVVPMQSVPRVLVLCVLAAEDADFYQHQGLDYPGMLRALARDVMLGRPAQGASTITQQVVKVMLLSRERTLPRKVRELILARRLEQELTKDEILHLYLNHIYFGHGRYGVAEAARFYFDKPLAQLTLAEASLLAGLPQAPARLSPRTHPEAARRRQRFVLDQLEAKREDHWPDITSAQLHAARQARIVLAPVAETSRDAPEVVELARRVLRDRVGAEAATRGGFTVYTTVDATLQVAAREALRANLRELDRRQGLRGPLRASARRRTARVAELAQGRTYDAVVKGADDEAGTVALDVDGHAGMATMAEHERYNPEELRASAFAERGARVRVSVTQPPARGRPADMRMELGPEGAVVVIDPRTRDVLAMVGSYEPLAGFNRATGAVRQPGSTFKPIVYALAIKSRRYTPASLVVDAPAVYDQWRPQNYEAWSHQGIVTLRTALANSINSVAVRVIEDMTPAAVVSLARDLGITTPLEPTLPLALGASDVRPLELVNAYATFAAGGRWAPTRVITRITGPDGREVALPAPEQGRDVLTHDEAYMVTSMLRSVVERGTAGAAKRLERPAAGKTGTSDGVRDAWFVGYTADVVAGVWIGFDDRRPLGRRESGARTALPIWMDVVRAAERGRPVIDFAVPSGVATARIDPTTGLLAYEGLADAIDEVFLAGTEPTEAVQPPDVLDPNTFLMEQFGGGATHDGGLGRPGEVTR